MPDSRDNEFVTREEFANFRQYLKDLADQQTMVLDERIRALTWRGLLALGVSVGLLRFDVPDPVSAVAVGVAILAAVGKAVAVVLGGRSL